MNSKKVNWIFLSVILMHFAVVAAISLLGQFFTWTLDIVPNFILSQGIILIPALLGVYVSKENLFQLAGFRKIKVSTVFKIFLFTFLSMPLTALINMISMLFVDNTVAAISGDVLEAPFLVMLFIIGIFGPFSEELVFRGIVYQGYRRSGTAFAAMLLSALLFALMHMNFNQAAYALVIGVMVVLLVEATGSLWSSMIFHMVFNSQQVCLMYLSDSLTGGSGLEEAEEMLTQNTLLFMISGSLIFAAVATALAACVLVWIAKGEKRENALRAVFAERKRGKLIVRQETGRGTEQADIIKESANRPEKMVTVPLLIGIVLALSSMVLETILMRLAAL